MENNQSTYLTGLYITSNKTTNKNNNSKTPSITNELLMSPEHDTYTSLPHPLDTRNQTVEFLKYSTYRTNLLQTEFLNFLLKEENYSNMNESEKFLREKVIENLSIINKNNAEIAKKKEEYKKIIQELNKELNNNLIIKPNVEDDNFTKQKEELQNKISLKKSDLNVLQMLYREEYKTRYMLIQQQKSEVENIKINLKQYEKYNIFSKKILIEANQKENLLNDVKNYVEQSREVFANEIDNKKKLFNDLEFEVLLLKKNTESIEKNLQKIIDMKHKVKELIKERKEKNNKLFNKNAAIRNYYFLRNLEVLKNTEAKNIDLDSLIRNYNDIQNKMHKLRSDLFNSNQQIAYLNKTLHKLNDEYKEKKEQNNQLTKNNNKKKNKLNAYEIKNEDLFKKNYEKYKCRNRITTLKNQNKDLLCLCNTKSNVLILYFKLLFEYTKIIYKSYDNSKLNFNFNLDNKINYLKKITESKYFELISNEQNYFQKVLKNDNEIFKEPNKFLLFAIQIFHNFFTSIQIIFSNILNITCFNNEDLMMKYPLSQFNNDLIILNEDKNNFEINKESNKVDIIKFDSEENKKLYFQYLSQSVDVLSQKNLLLSRDVNDILQNNNDLKRYSENDAMTTNYPKKVLSSFLNNKNTHNDIRYSNYINNYPSTTLLSLKRFFGAENQDKLFHGFKSADKNKKINIRYNNTKESQRTVDTSTKIINKNISVGKTSNYNTNISQINKKEKIDLYLSKEYNYELEIDEYPKKLKKKNILQKNGRKMHIIKYSSDDPQKQLIFARMNDLRNLELFTNNSNNKSTNVNDMGNDKVQESKFYEMYDKFKQKYFYNSNITNNRNIKNINRLNKYNSKNNSNSITNQTNTSNKNLNIVKGMKFIRNNSDFFYGVKTGKNERNKQNITKQKLPYIKNDRSQRQHSAEFIDFGEGSKESL